MGVPRRYIVAVLLCLGMLVVHAMRVNVGMTVVTIIDSDAHHKVGTLEAISNLSDQAWDSWMIGFLHAIFYIGYFITQLPGGYLTHHLPAHRLFGGSVVLSSVLNLLLPVSIAHLGYIATCCVRCAQGLSEGLLFASCYAVLGNWSSPTDRSRMGAGVLFGVYMGPVIGLIVSGWMTHVIGWQYVFYSHGVAGVLWFCFWLFFSYESPAHDPNISSEELKLIQDSQGIGAAIEKHVSVPWKEILLSPAVHALNVCNFARSFIFFFLLTNEPAFLNVFGYNMAENGILSALPHLLMALVVAASGPVADYLIADPLLTRTQVRKIFTGIGFGVECVCLSFLGFLEDGTSVLVFLIIGIGISGLTISGWQINHLDLAPRYAGVLVSLTTAVGTLAGVINPLLVGVLTPHQLISEWHHVFLLTAGVLGFSAVFYLIFGSGDLQPWALPPQHQQQVVDPVNTGSGKQKPYGTFSSAQLTPHEDGSFSAQLTANEETKSQADSSQAKRQAEDKAESQSGRETNDVTKNEDRANGKSEKTPS